MGNAVYWALFVGVGMLAIVSAKWLDDRERRRSGARRRVHPTTRARERPKTAPGTLESGQIPLEGPRSSFPPEAVEGPLPPAADEP